jgi:Saccharopine dehydrogenase NADP binding domain
MSKLYDVIIFGATGYTGKYAIREGVKLLKDLKWAVAGRNEKKLKDALSEVGKIINQDLSEVPIIIADVDDEKSIRDMTAQTRIIANCAGPYHHYGEIVVKSCIETTTHHVDVSGETQWIEKMQLKYNNAACEKGVYIISSCGFDSIPAEAGMNFLNQKFEGTINSADIYARIYYEEGFKPSGATGNYGTYHSLINAIANFRELNAIRKELFPTALPEFKPKLKPRLIHSDQIISNRWCFPLYDADEAAIKRSQRYHFEKENRRPVQVQYFFVLGSFLSVVGLVFMSIFVAIFTRFSCGIKILLNYPEFFTFGTMSKEPPSEETCKNCKFEQIFVASGWKEKLPDSTDEFKIPLNKQMVVRVSGTNPVYGATTTALLISARTILNESVKMPENGGVLSPGAAFRHTNFVRELQNNGFNFEVVKEEKI